MLIENHCNFCERSFYTPMKESGPDRCPWCGSTSEVRETGNRFDSNELVGALKYVLNSIADPFKRAKIKKLIDKYEATA